MRCLTYISFLFLIFLYPGRQDAAAQSQAQVNKNKRGLIDAKRIGSSYNSPDAIYMSREFIRIDSTYYVGWMYEGMYKANYAADYLGYKNAVAPLSRALDCLERDYRRALKVRSGDPMTYSAAFPYQLDYSFIAYQLMDCLSNIERPDEVYALLRRAQKWNFQFEGVMQPYCYLAWTTHRNRFYTSARYHFLKNSVEENEALAQRYLDSAEAKIKRDLFLNRFFQPEYIKSLWESVYHYRAMLYSYNFQMDSARRYYRLMRNSPYFSHNNYAIFLNISGAFRESMEEFDVAGLYDNDQRRLKEWAYYTSILDVYRAKPDVGVQAMKDMIQAVGSTPGFGWYNIALARCLAYNGNPDESERYLKKAEGFKELHIGTTLGQSHYDFSINLIRLRNAADRIQMLKFEHKNWWYNPRVLPDIAQKTVQKYLLQYLVVNQFAMNPERDMVVYKLFSSESTIAWDEIWYLIRDFTTGFFLRKYQYEAAHSQQRKNVKRYFQLFVAKLEMKKGDYQKAAELLREIIQDPAIDSEYEQLFLARVFEATAICAKEQDDDAAYRKAANGFYSSFPQLVPFSDVRVHFKMNVSGQVDKKLIARLEDCNIGWDNRSTLTVRLHFDQEGGKHKITYSVTDRDGHEIVRQNAYVYTDPEQAGINVAYRLFNIGIKSSAGAEAGTTAVAY